MQYWKELCTREPGKGAHGGIFTAMTVCHPENLLSVCSDSKTGNEETWLKEDPGDNTGIIADAATERVCKTGLG